MVIKVSASFLVRRAKGRMVGKRRSRQFLEAIFRNYSAARILAITVLFIRFRNDPACEQEAVCFVIMVPSKPRSVVNTVIVYDGST